MLPCFDRSDGIDIEISEAIAANRPCDCAELLPELVTLDEWGYPIVDPGPVPVALDRDARRAVAACPALALKLTRSEQPARSG